MCRRSKDGTGAAAHEVIQYLYVFEGVNDTVCDVASVSQTNDAADQR